MAFAAFSGVVMVAVVVTVVVLRLTGHQRGELPTTYTETTGTPARTWSDFETAGGTPGPALGPQQSIQVSCRVMGFVVPDHDAWWYRIESAPWNGQFYATSEAFYNNGATSGSVDNGVVVDEQVPTC